VPPRWTVCRRLPELRGPEPVQPERGLEAPEPRELRVPARERPLQERELAPREPGPGPDLEQEPAPQPGRRSAFQAPPPEEMWPERQQGKTLRGPVWASQ
jgi:hypothetical protein